MSNHPIILFDGICNLCNGAVQYVIKKDPSAKFKFSSLQSETGQKLLSDYQVETNNFNSFVLIQNGKVYFKSTAALKVARQLNGAMKLLYGFIIVPAFIRDSIYNVISNNRYKWFGKKEECMLPGPALETRFVK
ncbi:MAG: thiol-disulfide oxidoreductase DCC family protein [Ferruginibacter sp.]